MIEPSEEIKQELINFSERITTHGTAVILKLERNGLETNIQQNFIEIRDLTQGVSFYQFLLSIFKRLQPDKIIVTVKQKNGNAFKNPKTFMADFSAMSNAVAQPLNGFQNIQQPIQNVAPSNATTEFLKLQNEHLEKQLAKAQIIVDKYDDLKEENRSLKNDLYLVETKAQLKESQKEYESKNSLGSVLDRVSPMLETIISQKIGIDNSAGGGNQAQLGSLPNNTKLGVLVNGLNALDEGLLAQFFEINLRLTSAIQTDHDSFIKLLNTIRKYTSDFDEEYAQYETLNSK